MQANRTPYNSLYEVIHGLATTTTNPPAAPECDDVVCCTHGKQCDFDDQKKTGEGVAENNYVNLVDVDENEREGLIEHMKQKLELLDFFIHKKKKKSKGSSKRGARKQEELFPRKDKPRSKKNKGSHIKKKEVSETISEVGQTRVEKGHLFKEVYLGARSFLDAEQQLKQRHSPLGLYHRMPTGTEKLDIEEESRLFMVYKISRDKFRHYAIRSRSASEDQCAFFVDYGDPRVAGYSDLDDLIQAYLGSWDPFP